MFHGLILRPQISGNIVAYGSAQRQDGAGPELKLQLHAVGIVHPAGQVRQAEAVLIMPVRNLFPGQFQSFFGRAERAASMVELVPAGIRFSPGW